MKGGITRLADGPNQIRSVGSTGSPLPPEAFRWVYEQFSDEVWLFSVSGGTDDGVSVRRRCADSPLYEDEISGRMLGVSVEALG